MHRRRFVLPVLAAGLLAGCGTGDVGAEIEVSPDEVSGPPAGGTGGSLRLPDARPFNIHLKSSSQNPGEAGRGRGDSDAGPDGKAFCLAEGAAGGSATAEFRIGHRVIAPGEGSHRLAVQIEFDLRQALQASEPPDARTQAQLTLQLLALDGRRRVLARSALIAASSDESAGSASETHLRRLAFTLEPHQTCDIILYGKVEATSAPAQEASARLDVRGLRMALDFQPVATRPAASQP